MEELRKFAAYIRKSHLHEYVRESLRLLDTIDIPLMRYFRHLSQQQLFDMSVVSSDKFLSSLENDTALEEARKNLRQWEDDKLEGIGKTSIVPTDLILIYTLQKKALLKFLSRFTSDINQAEKILQETEDYFSRVQNEAMLVLQKIQRETEEALKESEDMFSLMVNSVKDYSIFLLSPEGNVVSWNEGAESIKGYKASEIIGKHMSVFYTAEDKLQGMPEHNLRVAKEKGYYETEGWRLRKDGSRFMADVVFTTLYDSKKQLKGYAKITRDITQAKNAEDQLRRSNERFMKIFSLNPIPTYIANSKTRKFLYANEAFERLFQIKNEDLIGKTAIELQIMTPETREGVLKHLEENKGNARNLELQLRTGNGELKDILVSSDTIEIDHEECFVAALIDITIRRKMEKELVKRTEELARSNTE
ncbi:MAG: PAS domain-containing protein, partial [Bacteroidia bacterium]